MIPRPDLAALALCALAVVGIVVLAVLRQPIPDVLPLLATTALGVGGGVALNGKPPAQEDFRPAQLLQQASAANLPVPAPVPVPRYDEPATGVFARVATHD